MSLPEEETLPDLPEREELFLDPRETEQVNNTAGADNTENKDNASNTDSRSKSTRTRTSKRSSTSSATLKAQAKAEVARAQLLYSEKEAAIMKQKTELEANLHILSCQKAVAIAEAEVAVYEEEGLAKTELSRSLVGTPANPMQRTAEYVQKHSNICLEGFTLQIDPLACHKAAREQCEMVMNAEKDNKSSHTVEKANVKVEQQTQQKERLNPPKLYPYDTPQTQADIQGVQDITRYLTRREMLSTGLLQFDDHPENYWAWKASFPT